MPKIPFEEDQEPKPPFEEVQEPNFYPLKWQEDFVEMFANLINFSTRYMGKASGRTTARKMLCNRIMADDKD